MPDVQVENRGTILLFRPLTTVGREWLDENTDGTWFGGALAVEPRYAEDLAEGIQTDGLEVEGVLVLAPPAAEWWRACE